MQRCASGRESGHRQASLFWLLGGMCWLMSVSGLCSSSSSSLYGDGNTYPFRNLDGRLLRSSETVSFSGIVHGFPLLDSRTVSTSFCRSTSDQRRLKISPLLSAKTTDV